MIKLERFATVTGLALILGAAALPWAPVAKAADEKKLTEEIVLLGKLGRSAEREALLDRIPADGVNTSELGAAAADARLDEDKTDEAMAYIDRIRQISPGSAEGDRLEARMLLAMDRPSDALSVIDRRLAQGSDVGMQNLRLYPLMQLERWQEAAEEAERPRTADDLYFFKDRRQALIEGRPSARVAMKILNGPSGLRERTLTESIDFWSSPVLRWSVLGEESYFTRPSIGDVVSERETMLSHEVKAEWLAADGITAQTGWRQSYADTKDYAQPFAGLRTFGGGWDASMLWTLDRPITSPVEAIAHEASEQVLKTTVHKQVTKRIAAGYDFEVRRARMNGADNLINGANDLGELYTHDLSSELRVFDDPIVTLQYHYLTSKWEQSFDEAETVLGLLEKESRHTFGMYTLFRPHRNVDIHFAFSQARDMKRDTWQLVYSGGLAWWITERMRLDAGLEYDYGDSGVSGGGNSTVGTLGLTWGWG